MNKEILHHPLNDGDPEYWTGIAESDLISVHILERERGPWDVIVYHCQQCIEKILKAEILRNAMKIPRIHDLERLFALTDRSDHEELLDSIIILNTIAMNCRYPISEHIDELLGKKALKAFNTLLSSLAPELGRINGE